MRHAPLREPLARLLPVLAGAAVVLVCCHRLLNPDALLAARDITFFHLPLRTAFAALARRTLPLWNPLQHGGQPILSNPNYAAFYPPTWLALAVPPHVAINLLILGHATLAFAGAWRLARHLGCTRQPALLAALAFAGSPAFVAGTNSLNLFCGLAWMPWVLLWGDRALGAPRAWRSIAATATALAAQLLAGEPVAALLGAAALLALTLTGPRPFDRRLPRLLAVAVLAALLAAVQLLPTAARLGASPRSGGLAGAAATTWSTAPARLVEWVLPRFFGDPARADEGLYFGWHVHDQNFPYVVSIYSGLPIFLLALAALARWPVARRGAWLLMLAGGLALALGRHDPLYVLLVPHLPLLNLVRYPEKFLLLGTVAIPFAAALGWQHLLARRRAGDGGALDFPLALAVLATATAGAFVALLALRPDAGAWFVEHHTLLPPAPEAMAAAVAYLRREALVALLLGLATTAVFAALRHTRLPGRAVGLALVALVAGDLVYYGQRSIQVVPASRLLAPPALLAGLPGAGRIFSDVALAPQLQVALRSTEAGPAYLWTGRERLEPYAGNLWGLAYALEEDYDLMLTEPGRQALALLRANWSRRTRAERFLGSWGVSHLVLVRPVREVLADRLAGRPGPPARLLANPFLLPRYRFTPQVRFHPDRAAALAALDADDLSAARREHWIDPAAADPGPFASAPDTRLVDLEEGPAAVSLRYRASAATYFVAAITYDRGWRATLDQAPLRTYLTAGGQIGVALPAGEHRLRLAYREATLPAAVALSLLGLLAAGGLLVAGRPRPSTAG